MTTLGLCCVTVPTLDIPGGVFYFAPSTLRSGQIEKPTGGEVVMTLHVPEEGELLPRVVRFAIYLQYLFPKRIRLIFLGAFQDEVRANLEGRAQLPGKWSQRWMDAVLIILTGHIVIQCLLDWITEYTPCSRRRD